MCIQCQSSRGKTFQLKMADYEEVLSRVCNDVIEVMFGGHKYVLSPTQGHFKSALRRAQNIVKPKNINGITIL